MFCDSNPKVKITDAKHRYPDLSALKPLLTMVTIKQYSKLSMMIYEALKPYIQIFDNEFISFIDLLSKKQLIDLNHIKI